MTPLFLERPQLWSALGPDLASAVTACRTGMTPMPNWFELHEFGDRRPYLPAVLPTQPLTAGLATAAPASLLDRLNALIAAGIDAAHRHTARDPIANDTPAGGALDDCLLVLASTTLDIGDLEREVGGGAAVGPALSTPLAWLADALRQHWGFAAAFTLNTACTSAANALLYAGHRIARGDVARALILAFETPSQIACQGFGSLELTSPSGRYRPFHPDRDGLVLGEAYASVVLTATPATPPVARLLGGYSACDTSSLTTTREDGSEIERVMRRALRAAGLDARAIALAKLHGTATAANDLAERNGMTRLFGQQLPALGVLKPYLGHTLGACGLAETLLLLATLRDGQLPPLPYAAEALLPLPSTPVAVPTGAPLMANYFGFGGNNASLILAGCDAWPAAALPRPACDPQPPTPWGQPDALQSGSSPAHDASWAENSASDNPPFRRPAVRAVAATELAGAAGVSDKDLKQRLSAQLASTPRRLDRLSLQALLGVAPLRGRVAADSGLYVAARYPARPNILGLLDSVCAQHKLPKPFEFVNSVSNAAGFQVAQLLGLEGPNLFIGAGDDVWPALVGLAEGDLANGTIAQALLVLCDEQQAGDFRVQTVLLEPASTARAEPSATRVGPGPAAGRVDFASLSRDLEVIRLAPL